MCVYFFCQGGHFGFVIDEDFSMAETNPCETYGNPYLTTHMEPFAIEEVELWGFDCAGVVGKLEETISNKENMYVKDYESIF